MIRLALSGASRTDRELVDSRLRGAVLQSYQGRVASSSSANEFDAVVFSGPVPDVEVVTELLTAGKHVLLSAGARLTDDSLKVCVAAASRSGVQLSLANPDRFRPSTLLIREQLDAGKLGEPGLVRLHHWQSASETTLPVPPLTDEHLHALDLVLWLMGKRPDLVYATGVRDDRSGYCLQVHLGFPSGGMALLDFTNRLPKGDGYRSLSVIGSTGAAYADDHQNVQLLFGGGTPHALFVSEQEGQLGALVQDFACALQTNRDLTQQAATWIDVLRVSSAVEQSYATGRAISREDR